MKEAYGLLREQIIELEYDIFYELDFELERPTVLQVRPVTNHEMYLLQMMLYDLKLATFDPQK